MVGMLSFSTMVSMWFYGVKCAGFLFGAEREHYYTPVYISLIVVGAVVSHGYSQWPDSGGLCHHGDSNDDLNTGLGAKG